MVLKVQQPNLTRKTAEDLTWGDRVFAHWTRDAMVVLTD
ncbi:hypothetical protein GALL_528610 [mine drainage metagenome]|uniref:Transport-associated OB type 2 domain-containing protein n=1 Tax=mine drainage metagenome TaxID=410659 RepID=A0A1J5P3B9_9ZZZZ